jgi:hypothetical protein
MSEEYWYKLCLKWRFIILIVKKNLGQTTLILIVHTTYQNTVVIYVSWNKMQEEAKMGIFQIKGWIIAL